MKQTKYFESQAAFEVYYPDGKVPSKELAVIGDYDALATSTNDFGGVYTQAEMLTPSGSISITANGSNIDVAQYEKANVNVPIPEGYIIPSGSISITENGEGINIAQYATATVNVPTGPNIAADVAAWQSKWGPYLKQASEAMTELAPDDTSSTLTENSQWTMTNLLNGTAGLSDALAFYHLMMYVYLGHGGWENFFPETSFTISDSDKLFPYSAEEFFVADYNSLDAQTGIIVGKRSSNLYDFTSNYTTNYYYVFAYDGSSFALKGGASTDVGGVSGKEFISPYQLDYLSHETKIGDDYDAEIISEGFGSLYTISANDWYSTYISPYFLNSISSSPEPEPSVDYSTQYLTFEAIEDSTFTFSRNALQYSVDNGSTWTELAANTASPTVSAGNKILWKQTGVTPDSRNGLGVFTATGNFNAYGNIMSLLYGDDFENQVDLTDKPSAFRSLFENNTNIVSAEHLIIPATTLERSCYEKMFYNCSNLTSAPELPATTLADNCYYQMFRYCSRLTTAPVLPATTFASQCYKEMFSDCSSLNYIKCLATNLSGYNATYNWVNTVASTGTFVKPSSTDWSSKTGTSGIPSGWTVEDAA